MQKIMFDDKFGLTQAVLNGTKTMTRRIIPCWVCQDILTPLRYKGIDVSHDDMAMKHLRYKVGEVVAIAQRYKDAFNPIDWVKKGLYQGEKGWTNKMFVKADMMPHQIRITDARIERLHDISDEDCMKEGIRYAPMRNEDNYKSYTFDGWKRKRNGFDYDCYAVNPHEAFRVLIDKMSGKGTWNRNPWVFVYSFELVK